MKVPNKKPVLKNRTLLSSKLRSAAAPRKRRRIRQTLDRFIVVAVNANSTNSPKDTSGWTATLTPETGAPITADFDDFGVARFTTISTLTDVSYTLRIRNANNMVLVTRAVPANREFYVARF
ncbi:hypothetical protein [Paenibacillus donghaensis]|uniref:Uncharacterized protein n=1 Tax=Paenibacillus donghaensis TaxID=414771 RepID=A0A2Z2KRW5_9BACL|nr:hypothetical protein [Paenibacillus donghaensis]ASA23241.1 hypothetical protein B9T62_21990 [Paenibacillus donghaensis]